MGTFTTPTRSNPFVGNTESPVRLQIQQILDRVCMCVCMYACVRARACVCVCVCVCYF
jgi:hypothetical protein